MYKIYTKKLGECFRHALFSTKNVRITTVLFFFLLNGLSMKLAAQKLDYVKSRTSIAQLFKEIKRQTGYSVTWNEAKLDGDKLIPASFKGATINEVMKKVLSGTDLEYTIINKTIVINEKPLQARPATSSKQIVISGRVLDTAGVPLSGANVMIDQSSVGTVTDGQGNFRLMSDISEGVLIVKYVGYANGEVAFYSGKTESLAITLRVTEGLLSEVSVVSTGYQNIPKERATGSFTIVSEDMIDRSVGTNILDRLEGIASGLITNMGLSSAFPTANTPKVAVHGRSTIFANSNPLIVLNGFPFEGTIDQINAADIESINILKDAAAASIWGARSGNGVIVITTKNGDINKKLEVEFNSTVTSSAKPNLFYSKQISSGDFIGLEKYLFDKGFFTSRFSNPYNAVSQAVEIFNQRKSGLISSADSATAIQSFSNNDVRSDMSKYLYRAKTQQQYQLNLKGGGNQNRYYFSSGYDKNQESAIAENYERLTLNANNAFTLLKNRLELSAEVSINSSKATRNSNAYIPYVPYEQMVDAEGNSLSSVHRSAGLRMSYTDTAGKGKLLDWRYRPKDELSANSESKVKQYRVKLGGELKLIEGLKLISYFQFLNDETDRSVLNTQNSYYTRNLINQYSAITSTGVTRPVPLGDIYSMGRTTKKVESFRTQMNFDKNFNDLHQISVIAGYEESDNRTEGDSQIYYGYNTVTLTNANQLINPQANYKYYYSNATGQVATAPTNNRLIDINQSYYSNASYTYDKRYTFSGSARRDESNLFGVKTNQKGVPLWSVGLAWTLSEESFAKADFIDQLKLRLTYGYNGNVDKSVSAYLTATTNAGSNLMGNPYATIINPPNLSLRWEKIKTWNAGLDFSFLQSRLTGSLDVYRKNAMDLIGNNPIAFQSGIIQFKGNGANLLTNGVDLILTSRNLDGALRWVSTLLLNFNTDKVTKYDIKHSSNSSIINGNNQNPLEGYPFLSVFSFPSAGLDATGAAQGYINGEVTKDYAKILSTLDPTQIKYHGPGVPRYFGSIMNTLNYRNFELSMNMIFKFRYYSRRTDVFSGSNYGSATNRVYQLADFEKRWQNPGDENITRIPALAYQATQMSNFFQNSDDLVTRADHIRINDVRLAYRFRPINISQVNLKNLNLFFYARNLGLIWRKNNLGIDPDYGTSSIPQPFSLSFGINATL